MKTVFKKYLSLIVLIILSIFSFNNAEAQGAGSTVIVYLGSGQSLPSGNPSTLFVENGLVGIHSADKLSSRISTDKNQIAKADYYLTITYDQRSNILYLYNNGNRIGNIPLQMFDLNLIEFTDNLRDKSLSEEISFFSEYSRTFSPNQVKSNYRQNYMKAKNLYQDSNK